MAAKFKVNLRLVQKCPASGKESRDEPGGVECADRRCAVKRSVATRGFTAFFWQ